MKNSITKKWTRGTPEVRFVRFLDPISANGCVEWNGAKDASGYGLFQVAAKKTVRSHRVAMELSGKKIPPGMEVLHSCDNPGCVNVEHLSIGTHAENMRDMGRKARCAKRLSVDDARAIRQRLANGEKQGLIAKDYGVDNSLICKINRKVIWTLCPQ